MSNINRWVEPHFRVSEVAAQTGLSARTIIRQFEDRPGVKIMGERIGSKRTRRYRTILIPKSVLEDWLRELE